MILNSYLCKRKTSKEIEVLRMMYMYLSKNRKNSTIQDFKNEIMAKEILHNNKTKFIEEYSTFQNGEYSNEYCSIYEKMMEMNTFEDGLKVSKMIKDLEIKLRKEVSHYSGIYINTLFFTYRELFCFGVVGYLIYLVIRLVN